MTERMSACLCLVFLDPVLPRTTAAILPRATAAVLPRATAAALFTSRMILYILLVIPIVFGAETLAAPVPVLTIKSPDGDLIDCINRAEQPAFRNPLLKDHLLQEYPSGMEKVNTEKPWKWQVWHATGMTCPVGTIPIRRDLNAKTFHAKYHPQAFRLNNNNPTYGHQYAVAFKENQPKIYGTRATLNVWDPIVESPDDFSLAQIWLASGSYNTSDINTIEAGWQIFPDKYHDHQPRLFTFWTRDAYNTTGCYSTRCPGFVHTSSTIALEAAITRTSTPGGTQLAITIQIWKDHISGNWWLGLGLDTQPVGYWPAAIFTLLSDYATIVHWGGEILYRNSSGMNTITQMGSGEFANKGFRRAAYFCNLKVAEENDTLLPVQDFRVKVTHPNHYTLKKSNTKECGQHFYFGGPGPQRSGIVRGTSFLCYFVYFVFILFI